MKFLFHIEGKKKGNLKFHSTSIIKEGKTKEEAMNKIYQEYETFNVTSSKKL